MKTYRLCLRKAEHSRPLYAISGMKNVGVCILYNVCMLLSSQSKWFVKETKRKFHRQYIASNAFRVQPQSMTNRSNSVYWRNINWFKKKKLFLSEKKIKKKIPRNTRRWGKKKCMFIFCRPASKQATQPHTRKHALHTEEEVVVVVGLF